MRQRGRVPVREVRGRRHDPRARDALDRRGDGHRLRLRARVREEPARGGHEAADEGRRVPQSVREARQAAARRDRARGSSTSGSRSSRRTARPRSAQGRSGVRGHQQGARRPAALRRRDGQPRDRLRDQHDRRRAGDRRLAVAAPRVLDERHRVLHDAARRARRARGDRDREARRAARRCRCRPTRRRSASLELSATPSSSPSCAASSRYHAVAFAVRPGNERVPHTIASTCARAVVRLRALRVLHRRAARSVRVAQADQAARVDHLARRVEHVAGARRCDRDRQRAVESVDIDEADRQTRCGATPRCRCRPRR